jgi:hypothetical protein
VIARRRPARTVGRASAVVGPLALATALVVSACGGDDGGDGITGPAAVSTDAAAENGGDGDPTGATAAACQLDYETVAGALLAFVSISPDEPVSDAALVAAGLLAEESQWYDVVGPDDVDPAPGSPCTYDPTP